MWWTGRSRHADAETEAEMAKAEAEAAKAAKADKAEAEAAKKNARCELSDMITREWEHFGIECDILREMVKVYSENFEYFFYYVEMSGDRPFTLEESNDLALATCAFFLMHQDPCNWYTTLSETESQAMFDRQTPSNKGTKRGNSGRKSGKGAKRGNSGRKSGKGRKKVAPPKV